MMNFAQDQMRLQRPKADLTKNEKFQNVNTNIFMAE